MARREELLRKLQKERESTQIFHQSTRGMEGTYGGKEYAQLKLYEQLPRLRQAVGPKLKKLIHEGFSIQSHCNYHPQQVYNGSTMQLWWNLYWDAGPHIINPYKATVAMVVFDLNEELYADPHEKGVDFCDCDVHISSPSASQLHSRIPNASRENQIIIHRLQGTITIPAQSVTPWTALLKRIEEEVINFLPAETMEFYCNWVKAKGSGTQEQLAWEALDRIVNLIKQ